MAAILLCCPKCKASLKLATRPAEGMKVKCPKCATVFVAADNQALGDSTAVTSKPTRPSGAAPVVSAAPTSRPTRDLDEDNTPRRRNARADFDDENDEDERPQRGRGKRNPNDADDDGPRLSGKRKQKSNAGLIIGLCVGGGVLFVALALATGGLLWWFSGPQPTPVAKGPEIAKQVVKDPIVKGPDNAKVGQALAPDPVVNDPGKPPNRNPTRDPKPQPVKVPDPQPQQAPEPTPNNNIPNPNTQPPVKANVPPPQPAPQAVAGPVDLDKEILAKTSRATAFIRVELGNQASTGSGFLVKSAGDTAYIITNFHVIDLEEQAAPPPQPIHPGGMRRGMPQVVRPPNFMRSRMPSPAPKARPKVTVVLNSGTPEEQEASAEVVATDEETDLAALRVTGARNLPAALDVNREPSLTEQQPVYIFGFPMNKNRAESGHPSVTVGKGTIAGLRRDTNNELIDIHINGDLNPGNSGGPIIDANGQLVGIAVAAVLGKQIGFAIPVGEMHQMFKGRLSTGFVVHLNQRGFRRELVGEIWGYDRKSNVRGRKSISTVLSNGPIGGSPPPADEYTVLARLTDPMLKINATNAYVAVTEDVPPQPKDQGWAKIAKAIPVALKIQDQLAIGTFKLPRGTLPDQMFAFQFSYVNADGKTIFTQPHLVRLTFPENPLSVTLNITGIPDEPTRRYIEVMAAKLFPGKFRVVSWGNNNLVLEIDSVPDPRVIAPTITFGVVTSVQGRTLAVTAKKIELPPPTDAEVSNAMEGIQSNNRERRIAGADQMAKVYVALPERRVEVAKALEPLATDKDIWIANAALRALVIWGGPENIAAVTPAIGNAFTRAQAIAVLATSKSPATADILAKLLPDLGSRGAVSTALKKMGLIAEKSVIPFVTHKDAFCAAEACNILKEIGTDASIPTLTEAANGNNHLVKMAASQALPLVQARIKSSAGK